MKNVMVKWKSFYVERIEKWKQITELKQGAVHLLLFAFLQRVLKGGRMHWECALGRKECNIHIEKLYEGDDFASGPVQEEVIEVWVWREKDRTPWSNFVDEAVGHVAKCHMTSKQLTESYVIIVDQKSKDPLPEKRRWNGWWKPLVATRLLCTFTSYEIRWLFLPAHFSR